MKPVVEAFGSGYCVRFYFDVGETLLDTEAAIQEVVNQAGAAATGAALSYFDTSGETLNVFSEVMYSKGKVPARYETPYGAVDLARHVYQTSRGGKTYVPLDDRQRILRSATPMFAKQICHKYAEFGAGRVETDLKENHGRSIASSFIQNLATEVAVRAQATEKTMSFTLPAVEKPVKSVSVSLDAACVLTADQGWKQASVGAISLYDAEGERMESIYVAAAPEAGKATLFERLDRELGAVRKRYPRATYVGVADGATDNWSFLDPRTDVQVLDFFHATEHLGKAAAAAISREDERKEWMDTMCHALKHNQTGPAKVRRALTELSEKRLSTQKADTVQTAVTYFTNQKHRMVYAENLKNNLVIGSGVTEAACKVIIKQRLCQSGMRWKNAGIATVLSLRTLTHTAGRWSQMWDHWKEHGYPFAA